MKRYFWAAWVCVRAKNPCWMFSFIAVYLLASRGGCCSIHHALWRPEAADPVMFLNRWGTLLPHLRLISLWAVHMLFFLSHTHQSLLGAAQLSSGGPGPPMKGFSGPHDLRAWRPPPLQRSLRGRSDRICDVDSSLTRLCTRGRVCQGSFTAGFAFSQTVFDKVQPINPDPPDCCLSIYIHTHTHMQTLILMK